MNQFDTVFLVDDDPINNLINKHLLSRLGNCKNIQDFEEGQDALSKLQEIPISKRLLILLDINMPVLNGWEFLNRYAELYSFRNDKIVILSSSIDSHDRQIATNYHFISGFLEKPLRIEKIPDLLAS